MLSNEKISALRPGTGTNSGIVPIDVRIDQYNNLYGTFANTSFLGESFFRNSRTKFEVGVSRVSTTKRIQRQDGSNIASTRTLPTGGTFATLDVFSYMNPYIQYAQLDDGGNPGYLSQFATWRSFIMDFLGANAANEAVPVRLNQVRLRMGGPELLRGVGAGRARRLSLGTLLFGARAQVVRGMLAKSDAASYIRGLLIGSEIADALAVYPTLADGVVPLIGNRALCQLYASALRAVGVSSESIESRAACLRGFRALHEMRHG